MFLICEQFHFYVQFHIRRQHTVMSILKDLELLHGDTIWNLPVKTVQECSERKIFHPELPEFWYVLACFFCRTPLDELQSKSAYRHISAIIISLCFLGYLIDTFLTGQLPICISIFGAVMCSLYFAILHEGSILEFRYATWQKQLFFSFL